MTRWSGGGPFHELNNGGERLLRIIHDPRELLQALADLRSHIQGVATVIQGREASLTDFRRSVGFPIEGYKLVVLSTDFGLFDEELQNAISVLAKAGPKLGVTFLVHSLAIDVNPYLLDLFQRTTTRGQRVFDDQRQQLGVFTPFTAEQLITAAQSVRDQLAHNQAEPVPFTEVEPINQPWQHSSAQGPTFSVGRYGLSTIPITLGDEVNQRHNVLITGAVG